MQGFSWQAKPSKGRWYARATSPDGEVVYMHHLIAGKPPTGMHTDHWDRDGLNNRRSNLRTVTIRVNLLNRRLYPSNTSGFRGVTFSKGKQKWRADIKHQGKQRCLGYRSTKEEAAQLYDDAAKDLRGSDAILNLAKRVSA